MFVRTNEHSNVDWVIQIIQKALYAERSIVISIVSDMAFEESVFSETSNVAK